VRVIETSLVAWSCCGWRLPMADSVDFLDNAFKAMQIAVALEQNGKLTEALECCDQSLAILVVAIQGMLKHACV
jgi:hypothetical protein